MVDGEFQESAVKMLVYRLIRKVQVLGESPGAATLVEMEEDLHLPCREEWAQFGGAG
jgi:hypothetical protein